MKRNGIGRLFAALLALIMVLVLLPVGAAKASGGYLAVGGTDIDLSQNGSYCDGKIVFEIIDGKNVLTLNGYKLENYNGNGISADGIDLTIVGSAEIGVTGAVSSAISVYESNLTLNGDFTLRAQSVTGATLDVYGYLTVEGGALDVENTGEGRNAIYVYDRMTVNGGTVHAKTNGAKAISARDGITLNNGEAFLSGNANASEVFIGKQYPLYVGGEQVNDLNKGDIFGDGTAKFEIIDGKNVLTLNGYKLENYIGVGISADGIDLTIVGSAEIGVTGAVSSAISVYESNLTLNGDFTLRAQCQTGTTIFVIGYLTVEGGALDVENTGEGSEAIYVNGAMTVNGGTVHAKANGTNAINARIILNNGEAYLLGDANASEVFIGKEYPLQVGSEQVNDLNKGDIFGDGTAKFEIIDGRNVLTLNGYQLENYKGKGIYADGIDLTIVGSAEIGVTGATASAIDVNEGNLTLNGDFTLRAQCVTGPALSVGGDLTVEGGALDVENSCEGNEAIIAGECMTVNGGTVHAKANGKNAISADIILNNGEAFLLGDAYASEVKIGVPVEHTVTVVGGTADKTKAKAGDTVTITADDAEYGYAFVQWGMLEDVEFARGDALTTTFEMPDHDVTVTPDYTEILISDIDDQTYTGEEITLTFGRNDLTLDGVDVTLINGTDYSLTYANNVDAGTATVTVTFHDRVTKEPDVRMGTKSKTFTILPASIAAAEIAAIVDQIYQGKALTPEPKVTWNGKVLEKDTDYTLRYFNNVNVGTNPYVTVTGKGNFDENTDVGQSFRIIPAPLTITAIDQEYIYNGYRQGEGDTVYEDPAEIAQKVTVDGLQGDDKLTSVILDGHEAEVGTYPGRIQPSDAVIRNATGTVTGNYEITYVPGKLTIKPRNYTIEFNAEDVQFKGATPFVIANGSAQEPRVIVKDEEGETVPEDRYDVSYRENTAPGTGFAYVTFNDGSSPELRAFFKIYLRPTEEMTVENTAEGICLSWTPVEGAAGYIIYRRAWNNKRGSAWTTFERWFNTTDTTWTDGADEEHSVYAGSRYQYGVKAYFEQHTDAVTGQTIGGAFDNYNLGPVGPLNTTVRITTRTLKSVTPGTKQITVKWEGSKYFTGYQIQYGTDETFASGAKYVRVSDAAAYEKRIGNLISGQTYWVRVRSYHVFEGMTYYGEWSNVLSCTVK